MSGECSRGGRRGRSARSQDRSQRQDRHRVLRERRAAGRQDGARHVDGQLGAGVSRLGLRFCDHTTPATWEGIERESTFRDFYDDLKRLDVPVWLFRGRDAASAIPSDLSDADVRRYRESVTMLEVIDFPDSGHMVLMESLGQAAREVRRILALVDRIA